MYLLEIFDGNEIGQIYDHPYFRPSYWINEAKQRGGHPIRDERPLYINFNRCPVNPKYPRVASTLADWVYVQPTTNIIT